MKIFVTILKGKNVKNWISTEHIKSGFEWSKKSVDGIERIEHNPLNRFFKKFIIPYLKEKLNT